MSIVPEIKTSVGLMSYITHNPDKFRDSSVHPYLIALMKCLGGLITELVNVFIIVQSQTIEDVVKDFIAFGIIAEIDDLMALTLCGGTGVEAEISEAHIYFPRSEKFMGFTTLLSKLK